MNVLGITGISQKVIDDLVESGVRTIELRSSHNIASVDKVQPGNLIFVTSRSREDIMPGTEGVLARLLGKEINIRRIGVYSNRDMEEREMEVARLKLEAVTACRASRGKNYGTGKETIFYFTESAIECW